MKSVQNIPAFIEYFFRRLAFYSARSENYPGKDIISINELIFPLRYDIILRYKFFELYKNNINIFSNSFDEFFQMTLKSDYFTWYKYIAYPLHRNVFREREDLHSLFKKRVLKSVDLYNSFQENSFDPSRPIVLYTGKNICITTSDVKPSIRYFAGDGCHRIALLLLSGSKIIKPEQYIVKEFDKFQPLDNTSLLLPHLSAAELNNFSLASLH